MKTKSKQPAFEVADLLNLHIDDLPNLIPNSWNRRTLYALSKCRTAALGGHIDRCTNSSCGKLHLSYNSCRNRHCPKCQGHLREQWIDAREKELLNSSCFHVVFTLPDSLNDWVLSDPKFIYKTLFKVAWSILKDFGETPKLLGAKTGMISVLHTWGQNMSLHPHLHCIVPAGGITKSRKWKRSKSKGKFLFSVKKMSAVFRARFIAELRNEKEVPQKLSKKLFAKKWVIYCKQPFHGPKQVIEYLGRYTHKIAISNHRIKNIENGKVYFTAKDYRKGGKKGIVNLDQQEFIRRFSMHILPKGFTRIRHYGILSSTTKKENKLIVDCQLGKLTMTNLVKITLHRVCPVCGKGQLETVAVFDKRGPPLHWLRKINR
jgi:hypothetical protein